MRDTRDETVLRKGIDVILTSSQRARELTANLLTFARVRARRHEMADLNTVISAALTLVEKQLQQANIQVVRHAAPVPRTQMDPAGIQQVLLNLLLNAQHAMPDGGTLTLRTGAADGSVSIEVEDTGTGIPRENLDRIFEPFFTTKGALGGARTPGTGLGLTTAYNIVKEHEGTLTVRSEEGRGSAFLVTLPVRHGAEPEPAGRELRSRAAEPEGAPARTVLVVDDDPAIRALLDEVLRRAGYRVVGAVDGESAIRMLGIARVNAILLDRRMPGLSGEETYRRIRASHPELPLVFVSGADEALLDPRASSDPLVREVRKPFANEGLLACLAEVLSCAPAVKTADLPGPASPGRSAKESPAAG
jgi:two-component system cell cycle sensor histidine kinase/response regulator CckA